MKIRGNEIRVARKILSRDCTPEYEHRALLQRTDESRDRILFLIDAAGMARDGARIGLTIEEALQALR